MVNHSQHTATRRWINKFGVACRGLRIGTRGESSFYAHGVVAGCVIVAAVAVELAVTEWCVLLVCIAMVLSAELFNSALERLGRAIDLGPNPQVGDALDIASGAVLVAASGAAIVGILVFVSRILGLLP